MKNDAIKIFEQYISKFDLNNEKVRWKYLHSYRVAFLMEELARKLKLSKNEIIVAYILGLFHDIGRFPQLDKFDSYNDLNIDHGDLGYKILKEEGLLDIVLDKEALAKFKANALNPHTNPIERGGAENDDIYFQGR